ncbi:MAG TPA: prenyltransferase/squalene oxidase repeat-containing protein [Gemmataceae bacterium]|nr:prenyltransferase/squalene oxidase repeat-containing protein [Gemmataceae bacterium]
MRLEAALERLPADFRARHVTYLSARQNTDGGFSGREGESDLYYTGFALRGLAVLNALPSEQAGRAAQFLKASLSIQASIVDLFSLLYGSLLILAGGGPDILESSPADWPERVAAMLETLRTKDGGYAKAPGAASGSTYHTFLVALCYQMLGKDMPDQDSILRFVQGRRREDGGYVEIAPMRRSGTNPTAAGVGILHLLKGPDLSPEEKQPAIDFLAGMPSLEGGLRANDRIPLADLLSTFTGSWTLDQLGALDRIDSIEALNFVQSLEQPNGGFKGGLWDEGVDVEYTFYGLGAWGLLAEHIANR